MGKQRYTAAEVSAALRASKGMVSIAAQRLGVMSIPCSTIVGAIRPSRP